MMLVAAILVTVGFCIVGVLARSDSGPVEASEPADHSGTSVEPLPGPETETTEQPRNAAAREVAQHFLAAYLRDSRGDRAHTTDTLRSVSTPDLWHGLKLASPDRFPAGSLVALKHTVSGEYLNEFEARLSDGSMLVLDVVASGFGWRVSDVQLDAKP